MSSTVSDVHITFASDRGQLSQRLPAFLQSGQSTTKVVLQDIYGPQSVVYSDAVGSQAQRLWDKGKSKPFTEENIKTHVQYMEHTLDENRAPKKIRCVLVSSDKASTSRHTKDDVNDPWCRMRWDQNLTARHLLSGEHAVPTLGIYLASSARSPYKHRARLFYDSRRDNWETLGGVSTQGLQLGTASDDEVCRLIAKCNDDRDYPVWDLDEAITKYNEKPHRSYMLGRLTDYELDFITSRRTGVVEMLPDHPSAIHFMGASMSGEDPAHRSSTEEVRGQNM